MLIPNTAVTQVSHYSLTEQPLCGRQDVFYHRDSELIEQVTTNNAFKNSGLQTVRWKGNKLQGNRWGTFYLKQVFQKTNSGKKPDVLN